MAKQLDNDYDFRQNRKGRPEKYPWGQWVDGNVWELTKGDDYQCTTPSMVTQIHLKATARRLRARTSVTETGLVLQFYKVPDDFS